jgi:hypothetical protein
MFSNFGKGRVTNVFAATCILVSTKSGIRNVSTLLHNSTFCTRGVSLWESEERRTGGKQKMMPSKCWYPSSAEPGDYILREGNGSY